MSKLTKENRGIESRSLTGSQLQQDLAYQQIYQNLLESQCPTAARYLERLAAHETDLILSNPKFKKRVRNNHCLLLAIVDNVKAAELAYRSSGDQRQTLKLLLQTAQMIQAQDDTYYWLVKELYAIMVNISKTWDKQCPEILARIRFEYGVVLTVKGNQFLNEAIAQMTKALEVCKTKMWYTNDKDRSILHEDVCKKLCETLLRRAEIDSKTNPQAAAELAERAVLTMKEVGAHIDKNLYCFAHIRQSEYLVACHNSKDAFDVLNRIQNEILANDMLRNKCEFYFWLGVCHFNLAAQRLATKKLKLSLCLSEKYYFADLRAEGLLFLGKIHSQHASTHTEARNCFTEARNLFRKLKDYENEKLAQYLIAKLRAYQYFPGYIELIKRASWQSFCYMYNLMQWKQKMIPFWNEDGELHEYEYVDEVRCLLIENVEKEVTPAVN